MAEVLWLDGNRINYNNPPEPDKMVRWSKTTIYGGIVKGSFRTIAHIDRLNNLAAGKFNSSVAVIQSSYNTTVAASAGTHDYDAVLDIYIPGVNWWRQQSFLRANGFWCWYRHAPLFSNHIHGMTAPADGWHFRTRVGIYVPGQLRDYRAEAFGLSGMHTPGSDNSWFPPNKTAGIFELSNYIQNQRSEDRVKVVQAAAGWDRVREEAVRPEKSNKDVERVKWALQHKLGKENTNLDLEGEYKAYFGPAVREAYKMWQRKLGYTGSDANGIPGPKSLRRLGLEVVQ